MCYNVRKGGTLNGKKAREISKSGNYYITLKGNELFVTDEDKKMFVEILEKNFATGYCT